MARGGGVCARRVAGAMLVVLIAIHLPLPLLAAHAHTLTARTSSSTTAAHSHALQDAPSAAPVGGGDDVDDDKGSVDQQVHSLTAGILSALALVHSVCGPSSVLCCAVLPRLMRCDAMRWSLCDVL